MSSKQKEVISVNILRRVSSKQKEVISVNILRRVSSKQKEVISVNILRRVSSKQKEVISVNILRRVSSKQKEVISVLMGTCRKNFTNQYKQVTWANVSGAVSNSFATIYNYLFVRGLSL